MSGCTFTMEQPGILSDKMNKSSAGISLNVIVTSLLLIFSFVAIWIDEGDLPYTLILQPSTVGWACLISAIIAFPSSIRKYGYTITFILLYTLSVFLIANLMYYNTFGTQIPLGAYSMAHNLCAFEDSIIDSFHVKYLILPSIITLGWFSINVFRDIKLHIKYWVILLCSILIAIFTFNFPYSFRMNYEKLRLTHRENSATTVLYSPFANLIFQYNEMTKQDIANPKNMIESVIKSNSTDLVDRSNGRKYESVVIIIIESLESFVIGLNIDGIPITPNLSNLATGKSVLFAPRVKPEVGIARSMDAQLIINCGLLPPSNEAFCFAYPGNSYPSIAKIMAERRNADIIYSITSDMQSTYNQSVISKQFGYDNLLSRSDFLTNPPSLIHVDDSVFFSQSKEKLANEIWPAHKPAVIQLVSYSTHKPFRLPNSAQKIEFTGIHNKLAKYLNVVHRTDKAVGDFIKYLQQRADYSSILVVITGDHNAFSESKYIEMGINKLSKYEYMTPSMPLFILNAEQSMKIEHIIPQSSIYPTILELLGLTQKVWPGIEKSIFCPNSISYDKQAVSNYIIHHDYLKYRQLD